MPMHRTPRHLASTVILFLAGSLLALQGCGDAHTAPVSIAGGESLRGKQAIAQLGCGGCHVIPGVRGARGLVGPPLIHFSSRVYIAGEYPNTPRNLTAWLLDPPALAPRTAMPDLGMSEQQARDISAYLYTLE